MAMSKVRVQTLRSYMAEEGIDVCVLSSPENMQYFSGFQAITYTRPILFIVDNDDTNLIVPKLEEEHASLESTVVEHLHVYYEHPEKASTNPSAFEILKKLLLRKPNPVVGVEYAAITFKNAGMYESWGCKLFDLSPKVTAMRAIKDEQEQEYIREAGRLCRFAFGISLENGKAGITELEFEQFGTTALYNKISDNYPYVFSSPNCFTPSGIERTNMPHVFSGTRKFEKGDMVIHVRKPAINGYHGELERSFFIGKPNPKAEHAFLAMLEAQTAVMEAIKPGVTCSQMDKVGRDVLRKHGYAEYAIHRIGHGQGLGRHEEPYLVFNSDLVLEEGMVFTVEPGIYIPDVGGFRHSDTLIITKNGYENTTEFRRELKDLIV